MTLRRRGWRAFPAAREHVRGLGLRGFAGYWAWARCAIRVAIRVSFRVIIRVPTSGFWAWRSAICFRGYYPSHLPSRCPSRCPNPSPATGAGLSAIRVIIRVIIRVSIRAPSQAPAIPRTWAFVRPSPIQVAAAEASFRVGLALARARIRVSVGPSARLRYRRLGCCARRGRPVGTPSDPRPEFWAEFRPQFRPQFRAGSGWLFPARAGSGRQGRCALTQLPPRRRTG